MASAPGGGVRGAFQDGFINEFVKLFTAAAVTARADSGHFLQVATFFVM